jgi:2-methylisocitrate lyase-like PEP mutase family enzyme
VNARTDVYLKGLVPKERAADEAIARGKQYAGAGADGFFAPALADPASIRAIAQAVALPLNVMLVPGLPAPKELAALGVRRLSAGSAIAQAALGLVRREATAFLSGALGEVGKAAMPYADANALFR